MARVIVIGSGFAGLSAAARLAKLRHDVVVLERDDDPGGRLLGLRLGGERWAAGPQSVTLPGVFRDLFRKSGRPMDALIAISPAPARHHVLSGGVFRAPVSLDLPFGTRGAQHDAVVTAFGSDGWSPWVDALAEPWDALRRAVLEVAGDAPLATPTDEAMLGSRSLARHARSLPRRLRPLATDLPGLAGDSRAVLAVWHYVERNFGRWSFDGGSAGLAAALVRRLGERRVPIETGVEVVSVEERSGRPAGVTLADGSVRAADLVVWATGEPDPVSAVTAVRLVGATLPADLVVHGTAVVRGWQSGPDRWMLSAAAGVDPVEAAAAAGLDVRAEIVERHDVRGTAVDRDPRWLPRPAIESTPGVWQVGGAAVPGAGLEITGMGTAALAAEVGAVAR